MSQTTEQHRPGTTEPVPARDQALAAAGVRMPDRSVSRPPRFAGKPRPWWKRIFLRAFT